MKFKEMNAITTVVGPIRDLFLKHEVYRNFGIALLHKHFDIETTQRLADYRNISALWLVGNDTQAIVSKYEGFILPRSFRLIDGQFVPYEFDFSDNNTLFPVNSTFFSELSAFLIELRLDQLLGLRTLDKHGSELTVEVTEGNMNIMIKCGVVPENELVPAFWMFGKDEEDACHCREFCRVDSKEEHFESNHTCG